MLILPSLLLFMIVFLAPRNRILIFMVEISFNIWMTFFGFKMKQFSDFSKHTKLFLTLYILNLIGFLFYVIYLFKRKKSSKKE